VKHPIYIAIFYNNFLKNIDKYIERGYSNYRITLLRSRGTGRLFLHMRSPGKKRKLSATFKNCRQKKTARVARNLKIVPAKGQYSYY